MNTLRFRLLRTFEPREVPAYRISEVAQYLLMPKATVRAWAFGQGEFKPVLGLEKVNGIPLLSFVNLVEVHVLDALRREHDIPLQTTRGVLRILESAFPGLPRRRKRFGRPSTRTCRPGARMSALPDRSNQDGPASRHA